MSKYAVIFDVLKDVRTVSEHWNLDAVLAAVEHAEKMTKIEIGSVDLKTHETGSDALLHAMFPCIEEQMQ